MQIVGTNTTYLSNVVNRRFGMNFRMLVNKYRIAHATRLMHESEGKYELGTVIRQSGFASRSVFYDAFLRIKGISPNRYLEQENER